MYVIERLGDAYYGKYVKYSPTGPNGNGPLGITWVNDIEDATKYHSARGFIDFWTKCRDAKIVKFTRVPKKI